MSKLTEKASWLVNAGQDDMQRRLDAMTGTPEDIAALKEAIAYEDGQKAPRTSRLKPIRAKLKKFESAASAKEVEVTTDEPLDPAWDAIRETTAQLKAVGRLFLRGQVRLGMQLAALKKEHQANGGGRGGDRKSTGGIRPLIGWDQLVKQESGYSRRQADEFIRLFEASKVKLKKSKKLNLPAAAKKDAIVLFQTENPLTLNDEQWAQVDEVIGTLTSGETQASLMQELALVAKPAPIKKPAKDEDEEPENDEPTAGELAFHFFEGLGSSLINARTNPEYRKQLMALPLDHEDGQPLSLAILESEARALIADIEEIKQSTAKPTKGRTIS